MGTSAFAVPTLLQLFEQGYSIAGVVTQPDKPGGRGQLLREPPVKAKARELHLPIYQPVTLKDDTARATLQALAPDIIVVVAYGKILPPWLLELPRYGAVNVHGSLLPKYRGAAPIHWAIANGDSETGVCTMKVEVGLDTGPIYLCEKTAIEAGETVSELSDRLAVMGSKLASETVAGILQGGMVAQPQDDSKATPAPLLKKQHGFIDWSEPAERIQNKVRAFNPWPGTVTRFRNGVCKILKTQPYAGEPAPGEPGSIHAERTGLRVRCGGDTSLEILQLQQENRKPVSGKDFANGAHVETGEKFTLVADNEGHAIR
jgi:methionyl-tRNA formyltransferase